MKEIALVTGAAGFLGSHLVQKLLDEGRPVRALIRSTPLAIEHPNLEYCSGDVQDAEAMQAACAGVGTVFHTAAFIATLGGSAVTAQYRDRAFAINVGGTRNLLQACRAQGVARFVHTSSVDVCFNHVQDMHMDEHTPYATDFKAVYTETKIEAEKLVLAANGEGGLATCALRPDGIWGAGECVMFEALVEKMVDGNFGTRMAGNGAVHDHVHVDNLVHAHLLAESALAPGSAVAGKAYFVSDGHPAAFFDFVKPFLEGLGREVPKPTVPAAPIYHVMRLWQWLHFKLNLPPPMLTPHEVNKAAISHVVSSAAAERDFGYRPVVSVEQGMAEAVAWFRAQRGMD
ncbi:MAG: NAD-dependent epimerase/dehydratase family protein [Halioglobus sp.]|nr:NAD-dependent epimerase/dehydratase family protein [Halioglobus sp.]